VTRCVLSLLLLLLVTVPSGSYVIQLDRSSQGSIVSVKWPATSARNGIDFWVDANAFPYLMSHVDRVITDSFAAWEDVVTSSITFRDRGTGNFTVSDSDGRNVLTFDQVGEHFDSPRETGVIAFTRINWNDSGEMTDTDIVFNGRDFRFSVGNPDLGSGILDLQGVLTHEIGHLLGLDHSALAGDIDVRPTMYPYYFGGEGTLTADDISGASTLYPSAEALNTGTISGRVTQRDGSGAFGAHVVAYKAETEEFVAGVLSGTSGSRLGRGGDGEYEIRGLPPGDYNVSIQALEGAVTPENFGGIYDRFDTGFPLEFYDNASIRSGAISIRIRTGGAVGNVDFVLGTALPGFPYIENPVLPSNTPDVEGPYIVQAKIADETGGITGDLIYRVNGGPPLTLQLVHAGDGIFSAEIPGQKRRSVVEYRVTARDEEGNETVYPSEDLPAGRFEVLSLSGKPVLYMVLRRSRILSVFDTGSEMEVARITTGDTPLSVVLAQNEHYLFVANNGVADDGSDNNLQVIDTFTHRTVRNIKVGSEPLDLVVSHDDTRVFVTNSNGQSVSVIDVESLRETQRLSFPMNSDSQRGPFGIAIGPKDEKLYVTDIDGDQVAVMDLATGRILNRISVVESPRSLAISPLGDRLYVAGFDGGISIVDTQSNQVLATVGTGTASVFRLAVSPDGGTLYATDRANSALMFIDLSINRVTSTASTPGRETRDMVLSNDGGTIYVANQDSDDLVLVDAKTRRVIKSFRIGEGPRGMALRRSAVYEEPPLADGSLADFDQNGRVDFADFVRFARSFGMVSGDEGYDDLLDLNDDLQINFSDFVLFAATYGWISGK
jgi:YVTN family beta-propeller protein